MTSVDDQNNMQGNINNINFIVFHPALSVVGSRHELLVNAADNTTESVYAKIGDTYLLRIWDNSKDGSDSDTSMAECLLCMKKILPGTIPFSITKYSRERFFFGTL